ncbi:phosphotransferase family protein [Spirillospora sp. CA-255316]
MIAEIRAALARHLPHREFGSIAPLGEGLDNLAYEADEELIIRISREPDPRELRREAETLTAVGRISPLPVPVPVFADPEAGVLAYDKVPGVPLLGRPVAAPEPLAAALGGFLTALHTADVEQMRRLVPDDTDPPAAWLEDAEAAYREAAGHISQDFRPAIEAFLAAAPPVERGSRVFCHNDLGAEHILVDGQTGAVTGVIDWTDAAIADPMHDLARLYRDLGPEVFDLVLSHYGGRCDRERVLYYARCAVLEDIAYGLTAHDRRLYADAGLAHLPWMFGMRG